MFIVFIGIICIMFGYIVMLLATLFPFLRLAYMDWFSTIFFILPFVYMLYRANTSRAMKQLDRTPIWKQLIYYLRRDNEVVSLLGDRAFAGESFLDVPFLGLIEFLGKDCVYKWGDKKVVWGLENLNFTPDPRYFNLTHLFYSLGFSDSDDIVDVWEGKKLYLMGKVYQNMKAWDGEHGAKRLVQTILERKGEPYKFGKKPQVTEFHGETISDEDRRIEALRREQEEKSTLQNIHDKIDRITKIRVRHR